MNQILLVSIIFSSLVLSAKSKAQDEVILTDKKTKPMSEAQSDYFLVMNGEEPKFAKFDSSKGIALDGGSREFRGDGYQLTMIKKYDTVGGVAGVFYGVSVVFDNSIGAISNVKFYSSSQFDKKINPKLKAQRKIIQKGKGPYRASEQQ